MYRQGWQRRLLLENPGWHCAPHSTIRTVSGVVGLRQTREKKILSPVRPAVMALRHRHHQTEGKTLYLVLLWLCAVSSRQSIIKNVLFFLFAQTAGFIFVCLVLKNWCYQNMTHYVTVTSTWRVSFLHWSPQHKPKRETSLWGNLLFCSQFFRKLLTWQSRAFNRLRTLQSPQLPFKKINTE